VFRRLLLSTLLISLGPAGLVAAAPCCETEDSCCAGELPDCPVLPDGECSVAAANERQATTANHGTLLLSLAATSHVAGVSWVASRDDVVSDAPRTLPPPRFLLFEPLLI
jgi:hypothetical protein